MKISFLQLYLTKSYYLESISPIFHNISKQNFLDKSVSNNLSRFNHSSPMNNAVTNIIKHVLQLFVL